MTLVDRSLLALAASGGKLCPYLSRWELVTVTQGEYLASVTKRVDVGCHVTPTERWTDGERKDASKERRNLTRWQGGERAHQNLMQTGHRTESDMAGRNPNLESTHTFECGITSTAHHKARCTMQTIREQIDGPCYYDALRVSMTPEMAPIVMMALQQNLPRIDHVDWDRCPPYDMRTYDKWNRLVFDFDSAAAAVFGGETAKVVRGLRADYNTTDVNISRVDLRFSTFPSWPLVAWLYSRKPTKRALFVHASGEKYVPETLYWGLRQAGRLSRTYRDDERHDAVNMWCTEIEERREAMRLIEDTYKGGESPVVDVPCCGSCANYHPPSLSGSPSGRCYSVRRNVTDSCNQVCQKWVSRWRHQRRVMLHTHAGKWVGMGVASVGDGEGTFAASLTEDPLAVDWFGGGQNLSTESGKPPEVG